MEDKEQKPLIKKLIWPIAIFLFFVFFAIWRYLATGNTFYLFNFGYLGLVLSVGFLLSELLSKKSRLWVRRLIQFFIGSYMIVYLGFIELENMQIEGFFFCLFAGIFIAAALHYFIAKIFGPLIFGRGYCGWACWTAMVLDLLPWKISKGRYRYYGMIRYAHFIISLLLASYFWYVLKTTDVIANHAYVELYWFAIGNLLYYVIGISLAFFLKDNRAFCKYVCPIPTLLKITSRFSLIKMKIDKDKCVDCGTCEKVCPMDIKLLNYKKRNQRILSTECILCGNCKNSCPKQAINGATGCDVSFKEELNYK
ncbi:MAG: 4Fe-4S dicluster domain-containing protein [archaeon]